MHELLGYKVHILLLGANVESGEWVPHYSMTWGIKNEEGGGGVPPNISIVNIVNPHFNSPQDSVRTRETEKEKSKTVGKAIKVVVSKYTNLDPPVESLAQVFRQMSGSSRFDDARHPGGSGKITILESGESPGYAS